MMLNEVLLQEISDPLWSLFRILILIGLGIYILFAGIVVRQIMLMTDTLEVGFEVPIRIVGILHLLFALATFLFALLIL